MRLLVIISFFVSFWSFGQEDTTAMRLDSSVVQNIQAVRAVGLAYVRRETPRHAILTPKQIQEMQANDVGEILQKVEGVNLKSYGGLGGLKTISVRSLGSQHSAVSMDGFAIQNSQTGQINLAQLQTNNVEYILTGVGEYAGYLVPVSSQIAGNNVSVLTFEMTPLSLEDSLEIRANTRVGSFGQVSGYASAKTKIKKGFVSGFGNYRTAHGRYPYEITNGGSTNSFTRDNNDYEDYYFGGVVGYSFSRDKNLRVSYRQSNIDQGLPGAVILYNNTADERLTTADKSMTADFRFEWSRASYARAYANGNINEMRYVDPTYFNSAGMVDVTYFNRNVNAGLVGQGYLVKGENVQYDKGYYYGFEGGLSDLRSSDSSFSNPLRRQISGILGTRFDIGRLRFRGHISSQFVNDSNTSHTEGHDVFGVNPYLSMETRELGRRYMRHRVWYRNSLRVPSFNELYYNNIGNNQLTPEKANQFGYNFAMTPVDRGRRLITVKAAGYFNRITDKIVAIPTQNLFTWSIQNVGTVHAFGGEVGSDFKWLVGNEQNLTIEAMVNYSFQRSIDMTDRSHATFGHQIAYIPVHTGNVDFSLRGKKLGGKVSNYLLSKRYSLNENIEANEIAGFVVTDFSVFYNFAISKKQTVRVQCQLKNAFNRSYSYIRSFVMPGRNFLISINYAFN